MMMHEIIEKISHIEHGFKPIEHEAKLLFENHTENDAFTVAQTLFLSEVYQVRALAVFVLGYLASTDIRALQMLKTTVSQDTRWQVQEILAKAFDAYCHDVGYEYALPVIDEWLNHEHPNVCRAVTEGLRIWTNRPYFNTHPERAIQLISQHKAHESAYLRKSVGNALRDIAKKHRALVEHEVAQWDITDKRVQLTYKLATKMKG
jgi:3-methyladenine DNA glycosylase AlkD